MARLTLKQLLWRSAIVATAIFLAGCGDSTTATAEDKRNLQGIKDGTAKLDPKGTIPGSDKMREVQPP